MTYPWRKLRSEIEFKCSKYDAAILMVSGGVDSMFLLDFAIGSKINNLSVVHFQHHIRPDDDKEAQLVQSVCAKHGIPFHHGHGVGLAGITNQENEARNQRWNFVQEVITANPRLTCVITAHHLDDQIEHYFMASMRGRQVKNLIMKKANLHVDKVTYLKYKPFLEIPKKTLVSSATYRNLVWIEDATNKTLEHERNILRNQILPELMKIRNLHTSMASLFEEIILDNKNG